MIVLSTIQKESSDMVKTIVDDSLMIQRLFVLSGGLGWKVEVQKVYMQQQKKISKVKKSMSILAANLVCQLEDCQETIENLINPEEDLSPEVKNKSD